jgi:hypothetical protein
MADGGWKAIGDMDFRDWVMATDPATGSTGAKRVSDVDGCRFGRGCPIDDLQDAASSALELFEG